MSQYIISQIHSFLYSWEVSSLFIPPGSGLISFLFSIIDFFSVCKCVHKFNPSILITLRWQDTAFDQQVVIRWCPILTLQFPARGSCVSMIFYFVFPSCLQVLDTYAAGRSGDSIFLQRAVTHFLMNTKINLQRLVLCHAVAIPAFEEQED